MSAAPSRTITGALFAQLAELEHAARGGPLGPITVICAVARMHRLVASLQAAEELLDDMADEAREQHLASLARSTLITAGLAGGTVVLFPSKTLPPLRGQHPEHVA
jgi:hypothetical protein